MGNNGKECFGEIHLTLPNGREVVGKVPTLRQQIDVIDLLNATARGKAKAQVKLVSWFPKLVGLEEELNQLTMEEFYDVVNRFFGRRGSGNGATEQTETTPESNGSSQNTPDTTGADQTQTCTGLSS